jgi:uncharacterized membrane protein YdjX (TVP38/TMEM64 family)
MNSGTKKSLMVLLGFVIIIAVVWYFGFHNYLTMNSLKEHKTYLESSVQESYAKSVVLYVLVYIAIIALGMPGVPLLTMLGGFLFGFIPATLYAIIGATTGSTVSFLVIRYFLSNLIRGKYAAKLETFNEKVRSYGLVNYLLTMQLMGVIPYFVINSLAALADVGLVTFVWTTLVGSIPMLCIYAFAGRQIYQVNSVSDIFSPSIIGMLVFLVFLALVPLFLRFSRRVTDL